MQMTWPNITLNEGTHWTLNSKPTTRFRCPASRHDTQYRPKPSKTTSRLFLVLTYNRTNPDIPSLVTRYWPIFQSTTEDLHVKKSTG